MFDTNNKRTEAGHVAFMPACGVLGFGAGLFLLCVVRPPRMQDFRQRAAAVLLERDIRFVFEFRFCA